MAKTLLTAPQANPKTAKGESEGYLTWILHLSPHKLSGWNVCPSATAGCALACLNTAGRGRFDSVQAARLARTALFFEDRAYFMERLVSEIAAAVRKADRLGMTPTFRLNGTSDIRWETVPAGGARNVFALFPDVQFYDYTKHHNRRGIPRNYHLTYSLAEGDRSWRGHLLALERHNVAVVFRGYGDARYPKPFPKRWNGHKVLDGDKTDLRFIDRPRRGAYVALRAKGQAKQDRSGFVYDPRLVLAS